MAKNSIIFLFLLISSSSIVSQTTPTVEKKTFQRKDGKIFWHVDLPVYIQISDKKDMSNTYILDETETETMHKHANPFYWDGPGHHFIRHLDKAGDAGEHYVAYRIYVDGYAPVTNIKFSSSPSYYSQNIKYYGKDLKAILSAKDDMSGIDKLYYSLNGANYTDYSSEISFDKEGENIFKYYSVDSTGNEEKVHEKKFTIDITPPVTEYKFERDFTSSILSPRSLIKLSATDNIVGVASIYYNIDSSNKIKFYNSIKLSNLKDGEHKLYYNAIDKVKNEEKIKSVDFYLDRTPPVIKSKISGDFFEKNGRTYLASDATITLSATDNKAGVKEINYSINGAPSQVYKKPFVLPNKDGYYNIKFRGIDNVNNKGIFTSDEEMKKLNNLYRDNKAPKISYSYIGKKFFTRDTMFITSQTKIKLIAYDNESGTAEIKYSLNNNSEKKYTKPFTAVSEGNNYIKYTGVDNVKNSSEDNFLFVIDNTGPEIYYHMSLEKIGTQKLIETNEEIPVYASNTRMYLAATDKYVGTKTIFYSINGRKNVIYSTPVKLVKPGMYVLKIKSVDELGNTSLSPEYKFVVQ